ncbi:MAG: hypothetical protein ACRC6A_10890 [Fusobacteriaceae bacterium]
MISFNLFCLDSNDGKMNITAKVIDPLRVVHNGDIEFGNIFRGSSNTSSRHGFTIYGEKCQNIKVSLNGKNLNGSSNDVYLKHISSDNKLNVEIINISDYPNNTKLDEKGEFHYDFDAKLDVPTDAKLGPYSGTLTMSVIFQ